MDRSHSLCGLPAGFSFGWAAGQGAGVAADVICWDRDGRTYDLAISYGLASGQGGGSSRNPGGGSASGGSFEVCPQLSRDGWHASWSSPSPRDAAYGHSPGPPRQPQRREGFGR